MKIVIIGDTQYRESIRELIDEFDDVLMGDENLPIPSDVDVILCKVDTYSKSIFDSNPNKYFILVYPLNELIPLGDWEIINSIDYYKLIAQSKTKMDLVAQLIRIQNQISI